MTRFHKASDLAAETDLNRLPKKNKYIIAYCDRCCEGLTPGAFNDCTWSRNPAHLANGLVLS